VLDPDIVSDDYLTPIHREATVMSSAPSDRNLLFGVLALQMDFIDRDALIAALHAWVLDKAKPLGRILLDQMRLTTEEHDLIEALVRKHLDKHDGDPHRSLAAIQLPGPAHIDLQQIADADLSVSLARIPFAIPIEADPEPTRDFSMGTPSSSGLRFHILRPHAKGGLGEVFVARDTELHREVALKEIQDGYADHPSSRSRFLLEAEITGALEHPGIVPVYGLGQYADGRPFYAMRFIQGESLWEAIVRHHRTSAADSGAYSLEFERRGLLTRFIAVCNTIAYAHSRGVVHRDIKPANIMLGKYGETLVVDWGMAKAGMTEPARSGKEGLPEPYIVPSLADGIETQAGAAMGTPAYMSPEQATGLLELIGPASDIYSLGATLHTLLTGRPPIEGKDVAQILRKAQRSEWLPPRQIKPDVPPALDAVCRKAMAALPSARYATALDLAADVERWLADQPLSAYREPWSARSRRWMRRHRTMMSTAVGILVVGLVSTTLALVVISDANEKEAEARLTAETNEREANTARDLEATARKTAEIEKEEARKQKKLADQRRDEARLNQYMAQMNLVQREYEANNIEHVQELLDAQVPRDASETDFRNFEWYYWHRMAHRELPILKGHTSDAWDVSFSPDGRRLATAGGSDQTVHVWDAATGQELLTLKGHSDDVGHI
jgi:serine/threonine-protein kinase